MSKKKDGKVTLGMLKGKPVTTSVPSIAIKFHANAEELEDFYPTSDDESSNEVHSTASDQFIANNENDKSPLKLLPRLVKRSTSVDITPVNKPQTDGSPTSDPWRFFTDIKGKLTKSVEDKLTEIKSRNQDEGSPIKTNKKDSSLSDSEDISQSESSISRTCGLLSTTEGVEMSSDDDDTPSINRDDVSKLPGHSRSGSDNNPKSSIQQTAEQNNHEQQTSTTVPNSAGPIPPPRSGLRRRFKFKNSSGTTTKTGTVPLSGLSRLYNINTDKVEQALPEVEEDIENAVEAVEEDLKTKIIKSVVSEYSNIDQDGKNEISISEISGEHVKGTLSSKNRCQPTVFAPTGFVDMREKPKSSSHMKVLIFFIACALYLLARIYSSYWAGFAAGIFIANLYFILIEYLGYNQTTYISNRAKEVEKKNVVQVPAVEEFSPLAKYEGWMNEYPDKYNPHTYHISQTQPVYIRLQGNLLRISHTKSKVPKREVWSETKIIPKFTHHRIYNLLGADISLLPKGLTKKKHWSKKYPICITLHTNQMTFDDREIGSECDADEGSGGSSGSAGSVQSSDSLVIVSSTSTKLPEGAELENHSFQEISSNLTSEQQSATKIYLFSRTHREKEDWFYRFKLATHKGVGLKGDDLELEASETIVKESMTEISYLKYMSFYNKQLITEFEGTDEQIRNNIFWVNLLTGRVLYDCFHNNDFTLAVKSRIQKKLSAIKMPYFIEELICTELNLGSTPPIIEKAAKPILNDRGLWVDLDVRYEGEIWLILQTKLNLMKLKSPSKHKHSTPCNEKLPMYESDLDDSAESSSENEVYEPPALDAAGNPLPGGSSTSSKRFIRIMDRIAESKLFQAATDIGYIKRAMEDVSKTELSLRVELKELTGVLTFNIPPPPTDRIWVGFQPVPDIQLNARPCYGEKNINRLRITSWIENKLLQEFQKILVIPNMEDFLIPVMSPKVK